MTGPAANGTVLNPHGTRLHIFLGAGGVGKTTLSAAFAVHLAFQGRRVGLLSIDPARRLKTALGAEHIDEAGQVFWPAGALGAVHAEGSTPPPGELRAAVLSLPDSLRRWIRDEGLGGEHEDRLFSHPLFQTVAEKIASATEALAPVRMAEWLEQYPDTEDLIIDTAPGIHAVDFLVRPDRLLAFLDSKIIDWLRWFAGRDAAGASLVQRMLHTGAKSLLSALGRAGGENILLSLGELLLMMDQVILRMIERLEEARRWIRSPETSTFLVCGLRDDSVAVATRLARVLEAEGLPAARLLLNRVPGVASLSLPGPPAADGRFTNFDDVFLSYLQAAGLIRSSVLERLHSGGLSVQELPVFAGLEQSGELRLDELARLGSLFSPIGLP